MTQPIFGPSILRHNDGADGYVVVDGVRYPFPLELLIRLGIPNGCSAVEGKLVEIWNHQIGKEGFR